ncbi:serine hydrolase [Brevibacterium sp. RIT 803]|uniref:serine hydrolase n=1 Tax=Brevibacterium sp. RIT 803 TaxID=2810210 RepID=UPI00194F94B7|nr:serine hydrolase [Brevibacterium sp. RIT 803]MBM6588892.1 serine hydrolase [Brevibacterium sp. RIT 803]
MTMTTDSLVKTLDYYASEVDARTSWTILDLKTGGRTASRNEESVPIGDFDALIWYLALAHASDRGEVDLSVACTLESRHRPDGNKGVLGCMSNGLRLSLGDFLAQTVITGDPAAFAVTAESVRVQGVSSVEVVDRFLREQGEGGIEGRPVLSPPGLSGVKIGSTTTDEQSILLHGLVEGPFSDTDGGLPREIAEGCLAVLGSVLKGGGLGRGLPGYGPFKTKVAHLARGGDGNSASIRNDAAIFFDDGVPRLILCASVSDISLWQNELPGIAVAEDFLMKFSQACWSLSTGKV